MRPWIAFRIDDSSETLLIECLAPWLRKQQEAGALQRWFYLWYSERGFHLRLRMQPARGQDAGCLVRRFSMLECGTSGAMRSSRQTYDRVALAFGHTLDSVLAELLHAATAELALALLAPRDARTMLGRQWVLTAGVAAILIRGAVSDRGLAGAIDAWSTFTTSSAAKLGLTLAERSDDLNAARLRALLAAMPRIEAALESNGPARRTVWLLRRARERGARGHFVATHALHFFCNQMGLWMDQEHEMLTTLRAFLDLPASRDPVLPNRRRLVRGCS